MEQREDQAQKGSVGALLELAAELERTPIRPSDTDIRQLGVRLGLDHRTVRSAVRLRFGQETTDRPRMLSRFITPLAEGFQLASIRRPYLAAAVQFVPFGVALTWLMHTSVPGATPAFYTLLALYIFSACAAMFVNSSLRASLGVSALVSVLWAGMVEGVSISRGKTDALWLELAGLGFTFLAFWIASGMLFCFSAAAGGYFRSIANLKQERDADRQSLLRRVFDLSARLDGHGGFDTEQTPIRASRVFDKNSSLARKINAWLPHATFLFVVTVHLAVLIIQRLLIGEQQLRLTESSPLLLRVSLVGIVSVMLIFLGLFQLGVFAGSLRRTVWMIVAAGVALFLSVGIQYLVWPASLLMGGLSPADLWPLIVQRELINTAAFALPISAGAMAGYYWTYLERQTKLAQNDREVLAEELAGLRSRLSRETKQSCYLVVDVVGSTRMKESADPLAIEYSFTEYQRYVSAIVIACGGAVHSTAGDGAIASFAHADNALDAGRQLQERLAEFNRSRNTLTDSFRLRVGIHCGDMTGTTFSHVIDVAAHVEGRCPPGSVALTHDTMERLTACPSFQNLDEPVDGRRIAIVGPAAMELS